MKRSAILLLAVLTNVTALIAAEPPNEIPLPPNPIRIPYRRGEEQKPGLPKFDLDFPGGSPGDLVKAITKASGHPLNAIIAREDEDVVLPPLKLRHTDVEQLFAALSAASHRTVLRQNQSGWSSVNGALIANHSYAFVDTAYIFKCDSAIDPDAVWYFRIQRQPELPAEKACRFYQLNPYLKEHSVESITTAIETGWKMLGETNPPTLSFHKDTGLLIAVGDPADLNLIVDVLSTLERPIPPSPPGPPVPPPQPKLERPKTASPPGPPLPPPQPKPDGQ
jgi:hypothetical protein